MEHYSGRISPQRMELVRKVGLMGLKDLRKLAPIGNLGYANDWDYYSGYAMSELPLAILRAFREQGFVFDVQGESGYRRTTRHYHCSELGMSYCVDSSD